MIYDELIGALFPNGAPENFADFALALAPAVVAAMDDAQAQIGSTRHVVQPVELVDGRYMIGADIVPELQPGRLFAEALPLFDGSALEHGVEVMPWVDAVALIKRPININEADNVTLQTLSGVGASLADAIIAGRPWADPADLSSISGISAAMVEGWMDDPGLVVE
jgi:hypothetical protein